MSKRILWEQVFLAWLPDRHGIHEQFQRTKISRLNEFYRCMILKVRVGSVEENSGVRLIALENIEHCDPNSV